MINENVDTYLDAEATLSRLRNMESSKNTLGTILGESEATMEDLKKDFTGVSATKLQQQFNDVAETFNDFSTYLQGKINEMEALTGNITATDER